MLREIMEEAEQFIFDQNLVVDDDVLNDLYETLPPFAPKQLAAWAMSMMPNPVTDGYDTPEFNSREAFYMAVVEVTTERIR